MLYLGEGSQQQKMCTVRRGEKSFSTQRGSESSLSHRWYLRRKRSCSRSVCTAAMRAGRRGSQPVGASLSPLPAPMAAGAERGRGWCTSGGCHLVGDATGEQQHPAPTAPRAAATGPRGPLGRASQAAGHPDPAETAPIATFPDLRHWLRASFSHFARWSECRVQSEQPTVHASPRQVKVLGVFCVAAPRCSQNSVGTSQPLLPNPHYCCSPRPSQYQGFAVPGASTFQDSPQSGV